MNINIKIIPHSKQRYTTVGDYWLNENGDLEVRVSKMSDPRYEQLVIVHELIEFFLCNHNGIQLEDIDRFDILYEQARSQGASDLEDEPGNDTAAPYFNEHQFSTLIERFCARELSVRWNEYDAEVNSL